MNDRTTHSLTLLNDSSDAHMALWRLRAALPESAITVDGRTVKVAQAPALERVLAGIPSGRTYLRIEQST
jgi:hypothetical protein